MKLINKIKKNKFLSILSVLIVGCLVLLVVRFTYAFFAAQVNEAKNDITLNSDLTDVLDFEIGDALSIDVTPTLLPENGENIASSSYAKASLLANTTDNYAEYSYWVYFIISDNSFIYSNGTSPEVILSVTDPEGNPVTNIAGLTYGTFNGISGFDVTTQNGVFAVANDYTIASSSSDTKTEQTWNFTLTYLNEDFDQSSNVGNRMFTEIALKKEEIVTHDVTLISENTEIYGKDYSITNMLGSNGDFESQSGWSACNYDTAYVKYGNYACRLDGIANSPELTASTADTFMLDKTHMYYGRAEVYLNDNIADSVTAGMYWPIAEPAFAEGFKVGYQSWTLISKVVDRASDTLAAGAHPFRIDFNNSGVVGSMYFDGVMLIDLTATFGSSYPDKEYLDSHLVYFNNTASMKTIKVQDSATFKVNNVNGYTNLSCNNGVSASIDENGTVSVLDISEDTVCRLSA